MLERDHGLEDLTRKLSRCELDKYDLRKYGVDNELLWSRYTPLDLACHAKYPTTAESRLSLGANPGGSLASLVQESEATGEYYVTTPLHVIFEHIESYSHRDDEYECSRSTDRRTWGSGLRNRYGGAEGGLRSPDHLGGYLQNLVAYAELILRGVRLLLDHGVGRHIDASASGRGTPLLRFLVFAAEMRMRRRFLTRRRWVGERVEREQKGAGSQVSAARRLPR
ncbi:hypothetical protein DL769_006691 [Monosporascus sp. CRB-8-3]|nr:hypothetical protein DL769_006691 [Monosporascus sp. CRB-8-3]